MRAKKTTARKPRAAKTVARAGKRASGLGRAGDMILIDSKTLGSAPREGEILQVIEGEVSVRYRVRWGDGHETLISPKGGVARIVPASRRR